MATYDLFGTAIPSGATSLSTSSATYGLEFYVTSPMDVTYLRYCKGTATLSATAQLFSVDSTDGTTGTALTSPLTVYNNQAGAAAWYQVAVPSPVRVTPGYRYRVAVQSTSAVCVINFWSSGAGASGLSSGPLVAPTAPNAYGGMQQNRNASTSSLLFPNTAYTSSGYLISMDVVVDDANVTGGASTSSADQFFPFLRI